MVAVSALVQVERRRLRGRPHRADEHGLDGRCARRAAEEALRGQPLDAERDRAGGATWPTRAPSRRRTSTRRADYKRHLARVLCRRALMEAAGLSVDVAEFDSVEDGRGGAGRRGLPRRPAARARRLPGRDARAAAAARGRGRRRQDRGRAGAGAARWARGSSGCSATRASTCTTRSTTGTTRASCSRCGPPRRARRRGRAVLAALPAAPAAARGARGRRARRAADRRDRPRRRRVRGVPARVPRRLRGDDPRARARSRADAPAAVVLTSNRTRELHDALKRRCLYHWIDYPSPERERAIVAARAPGVAEAVARPRVRRRSRGCATRSSTRRPGVGETIVWAPALMAVDDLDATLGAVAEGARGRRPRARDGGPRRCLTTRGRPPQLVAASSRSRGAARARGRARRRRRGRRARRGRSPRSTRRRREDARLALRAALCAGREDLAAFDDAFEAVFGRGAAGAARRCPTRSSRSRCRGPACPAPPPPQPARAPGEPVPVPAAWSPVDARRARRTSPTYTDAERAARAARARAARAARAAAALAPHGRRRGAGAATRPTCAGRSARRCATPASRSSATGARRPSGRARSCSCSTSPARWRRTRGCCSSTCRRAVAARRRVEAFAFGTRLTRVTQELRGRDPDRALERAAAAVDRLVGRHADRRRRSRRSTASTAAASGRGSAVVDPLRRLGPRRPGRARRRDGPPAPRRAPRRLAQPARRRARATSR